MEVVIGEPGRVVSNCMACGVPRRRGAEYCGVYPLALLENSPHLIASLCASPSQCKRSLTVPLVDFSCLVGTSYSYF